MKRLFTLGLLLLLPSMAQAAPIQWTVGSGANGHYYELVTCGAPTAACTYSWAQANAAANAQTHLGMPGHLATITSADENAFIVASVAASYVGNVFGPWLGGLQPNPNLAPAEGWTWVTGETWGYTDWNNNEPNGLAGEDYLHFTTNPANTNLMRWNDVPDSYYQEMNAYVVEFETAVVPEPASLLLLGLGLTFAATRLRRQ